MLSLEAKISDDRFGRRISHEGESSPNGGGRSSSVQVRHVQVLTLLEKSTPRLTQFTLAYVANSMPPNISIHPNFACIMIQSQHVSIDWYASGLVFA